MSGMRIGLFTPAWPGTSTANGIVTSVRTLAGGLHAAGHHPVVISGRIDGEVPEGIPVVRPGGRRWRLGDRLRARFDHGGATRRVAARNLIEAVRTAIADHGIEAVLIEETHGWAGLVAKAVPIPVVMVLHGPWILHRALQSDLGDRGDASRIRAEGDAMRAVAGLISPSADVLAAVRAHYDLVGVPAEVIPNAIDLPDPAPAAPDKGILFVGRFDRHKGGDTAIEAFGHLHARHPGARLTFAGPDRGIPGTDGTRHGLDAALGALPETARAAIDAIGAQPAERIAALRKTHPVALIASRYENLNYTLLEAMAAGQAVVATAVGGPAEVLEDGKTALLVPPEDAPAMAAALARCLEDEALVTGLGAAARARVAADFAPGPVAARIVAFLDGLRGPAR